MAEKTMGVISWKESFEVLRNGQLNFYVSRVFDDTDVGFAAAYSETELDDTYHNVLSYEMKCMIDKSSMMAATFSAEVCCQGIVVCSEEKTLDPVAANCKGTCDSICTCNPRVGDER
jgi:hypothetical protein